MSKKETREGFKHEDWLELCEYVEKQILQYDDKMKLGRNMVLRLRGLSKGQFIANNKIRQQAEYSYKLILLTFKAKKLDILNAIHSKTFKSESQKFNYIMAIVENSINDIYLRMKNAEKSKKKTEKIEIYQNESPAEYKNKAKDKKNKLIDDIW